MEPAITADEAMEEGDDNLSLGDYDQDEEQTLESQVTSTKSKVFDVEPSYKAMPIRRPP